ncbi:MAG: hypothetical protein R2838_19375 [Caldilineaceae bacterium]
MAIPGPEIKDRRGACPREAGGQNVNKSATAVQLRFDIGASSLPETFKERLLALATGASPRTAWSSSRHSSSAAERTVPPPLERLQELVQRIAAAPKPAAPPRCPTPPSGNAWKTKKRRSEIKKLRRDIPE